MKPDNPSAFKHLINPDVVKKMSDAISQISPTFDKKSFSQVSSKLGPLKLKSRVLIIRDALFQHLPKNYPQALKILLHSLEKSSLSGFQLWPYTEFVQTYGLSHFDESMQALYLLTQKFTAEFAIRPFLVQHPKKTFSRLYAWSSDSNVHIRRLTSEGSRPRLPWGLKLHQSIQNPELGLKILNSLKYDNELYVRKSVANHLNDITKDHPILVIKTLKKWKTEAPQKHLAKIEWIQKQALRTLIKKGYKPALDLMGFGRAPQVVLKKLKINKRKFKLNEVLEFELQLTSKKSQKIAIDYIIHYQKANKKTSPKVFKLKVIELKTQEIFLLKKRHTLKPVTTRKDYPGLHKIEIQINGIILASANWHLSI